MHRSGADRHAARSRLRPGTALHALAPRLPALTSATLVDRDEDVLDIAERLAPALGGPGTKVLTEQRDLADTAAPLRPTSW